MSTSPTHSRTPAAARPTPRSTARSAVDHAELAARLTPRDRWIVRMLAEHRVLTTTHLTALAFTHTGTRRAQRRLRELSQMGLIDSFRPIRSVGSAPAHWVTTPVAFAVLAAEDGRPHDPTPAGSPHRGVSRGLALAHNQQLRHQLGVNTCLTDLITTTTDPNTTTSTEVLDSGRVEAWWGQARCHHLLSPARPDAYFVCTDSRSSRSCAFAIEYDTGIETLARVSDKLTGYHALALATAIRTPVLFWLPSPTREANVRHALAHARAALPYPDLVPVATAHPHPQLPGRGWHLHEAIWRPLTACPCPTPGPAPQSTDQRGGRDTRAASLTQLAHNHTATSASIRLTHRTDDSEADPSAANENPDTDQGTAGSANPGTARQLWVAPRPLAPAATSLRLRRR